MTDKVLKGLIFAAGLVVGSAVSYILTSKKYVDERKELIESYEAEIKELNKSMYADDIPDESQPAESAVDPLRVKPENKTDYTSKFVPGNVKGPIIKPPEYNDIIQSSAYAGASDSEPYLVTQETFEHDPDGYTQFELRYYMDDDYLCDVQDLDTPIVDIDKAVGYQNLEVFRTTDAEYIWVRDDNARTVTEIEVYRNGPCPINDIFSPE